MDIHTLRLALHGQPFGHTIHYHLSVPSTMPIARALAENALEPSHLSGTVVVADEQTAGRGRLDRRWETPPGRALLVSFIVAGPHLPERPAQLPMIAGLAVLGAVRAICPTEDAGDSIWLKWSNDLVALRPDGPVKMAGMLVESSLDSRGIRYAVLGIGINVNQQANEFPAPRPGGLPPASLHTLFGHEFAREALLLALCRSLSGLLSGPNRPSAKEIHTRWQGALINVGRMVTIHDSGTAGTQWQGRVVGTDMDGALLVEDATGQWVSVAVGDVSVALHDSWERPHPTPTD